MNYLDFIASTQEYYHRIISPVSLKYHLTYMELTILLYLANNPGHDTAAEIVRKRHLTKSHVSTSIKTLEEKGLLQKERAGNDRRTDHLILTDASSSIVRAGQAAQKEFYDGITDGLSEKSLESLVSCFMQMDRNIARALKEA